MLQSCPCAAAKLVQTLVMDDSEALALAALWGSIHNLRVLVNRGLAAPGDVDTFAEAVFEGIREGSSMTSSVWEQQLSPLFAEMRSMALEISN
jgi:hypothetical protein